MTDLVFDKHKKDSNFLAYIRKRIDNKQNFLCLVIGQTGTGKSVSAVALAEKLDPNFNAENIVFDSDSFSTLLNSGRLKKGSVIIYDEVGVGMSHLEFWSKANKIMNRILQTFRKDCIIVFFTTPSKSFLDSNARKLLHCYLQTAGINYKKSLARLRPYTLHENYKGGKDPFMKAIRIVKNKKIYSLKDIWIGLPSKKLFKEYNAKAEHFKDKLKVDSLVEIRQSQFKNNGGTADQIRGIPLKLLTPTQSKILEFLKQGKTQSQVAKEMETSQGNISTYVRLIRQKGYFI